MKEVSRQPRRWMGRLPSGSELVEWLETWIREHAHDVLEIRASGELLDGAVAVFDPVRRAYQPPRVIGGVELVSCTGFVSRRDGDIVVEVHGVIAQGGEMLAGKLTRARGDSLWVSVEGFEAAESAGPVPVEKKPVAAPAQATAPVRSLADAARALENQPVEEPKPVRSEVPEPEPGDWLDHPSFGIVQIVSEEDSGRIKIRLQSGSHREIMLDVFEVVPREPRQGKNFYSLRPRRR